MHTKAYDAVWIGKGAIEVEIKGAKAVNPPARVRGTPSLRRCSAFP